MLAAKHCSMLFPSAKTDCFLLCTEGNVKQTNLLMDLDRSVNSCIVAIGHEMFKNFMQGR